MKSSTLMLFLHVTKGNGCLEQGPFKIKHTHKCWLRYPQLHGSFTHFDNSMTKAVVGYLCFVFNGRKAKIPSILNASQAQTLLRPPVSLVHILFCNYSCLCSTDFHVWVILLVLMSVTVLWPQFGHKSC